MSALIQVADAALSVGKSGGENQAGNLNGRQVTHWSWKVLLAAGILSAVTAIAATITTVATPIIGLIPLAIAAGVYTATSFFGAFYLRKFSTFQTLENYVRVMAGKIDSMVKRISELEKVNQELEKINVEFQKIPKDWKEEIENGKLQFNLVQEKFERLKVDYEVILDRLEKLGSFTEKIHSATGDLAKETLAFTEENGITGEHVNRLSGELDELKVHNDNILARIKELDLHNKELDRLDEQFDTLMIVLKELFGVMKDIYDKVHVLIPQLGIKVEELKKVYPAIETGSAELHLLNEALVHLKKRVEDLLKNEEELLQLRAFREGNRKTFDAWSKNI